jgi:hypothetical protein
MPAVSFPQKIVFFVGPGFSGRRKSASELTVPNSCAKIRSSAMHTRNRVIESPDDAMADVYRSKTPLERLRVAFGLWTSTRILLEGILRSQHPDWEDRTIRAEAARRMSHGSG